MMAVLIGMLIQVAEDGWLAPSTLSLFFVVFVFILAGVLHPQVSPLQRLPITLATKCDPFSQGIGLSAHGGNLLHHHPLDVPLPHDLLGLQPERRVLGHQRGAEEEDGRRD